MEIGFSALQLLEQKRVWQKVFETLQEPDLD
jgi:hypothetical protein